MVSTLIVLSITLAIGYFSYFVIKKAKGESSVYHDREYWYFGFYLRWTYWFIAVWRHQKQRKKRLNNYRPLTRNFQHAGFVPTPEEVQLESPANLTTERHEDSVVLWGSSSCGRAIYAKVVRLAHDKTSVFLLIKEKNGDIYTLPNQPDSIIYHTDGDSWQGGGLFLECVQPMRTWRLKFNGYLRKDSRATFTTDVSSEDEEGIVEARLDLVWRSLRAPVDLFRDSDPRLLASALARERDADLSYFTSLDRDAYDQHGVLSGQVHIDLQKGDMVSGDVEEMATDKYWNLRGGRLRRWGMSEAATKLHRSVEFLNFFDNGDCLYHYTFSYPNSLTVCTFGYLQTANGIYKPMSYSSFELSETGEDGSIPSHIFFKCSGKFPQRDACISFLGKPVVHYSGDPWNLQHNTSFTDIFFGTKKGKGIAIFTSNYSGLCPVPEQYSGNLITNPSPIVRPKKNLVTKITDDVSRDTKLTGGKGSSLAILRSLDPEHCPEEIFVPGGLIVTSKAWNLQIEEHPALSSAIDALQRAVGSGQDNQIRDACHKAGSLFLEENVSQDIKNALKEGFMDEFENMDNTRFAVRSSGLDEDSCEASAAGQNLTVLGCKGTEEILIALSKCWASLVSYTSVQYRRQRGLESVGEMAVVIQEMVDPDVAGVIFTRHPNTGSPSSVTITANYGLGETVVSGSSEPDTITVHRPWRGNLVIESTVIGGKASKQIVSNEGTKELEVPDNEREKSCINEALAIRLARIAIHVEMAYRSPRDIEFAVKNDKIYLLQSRPITNLNSWSELEILTELDSASVSEAELFTRANTGEVFPLASTPLNISVVGKGLELGMQKMIRNIVYFRPYSFDPASNKAVMFSFLHACLNCLQTMWIMVEEKVTISNNAADLCIFGHRVTTQELINRAVERHGASTNLDVAATMLLQIYGMVTNNRVISGAKETFQNYDIKTERALSAEDVYEEISHRLPDLITVTHIHLIMSTASNFSQTIGFLMLNQGAEEISPESTADMCRMLASSCEGQESAGVPGALKELADTISKDQEVKEFLSMSPEEGYVWLDSHPGDVGTSYVSFINHHGHRCIQELEISSKSWGMDSKGLVKTLQSIAATPAQPNTGSKASTDVKDIVDSLTTQLKPLTMRALEFFLPICRVSVQRREAAKSYTAKVIDGFRKAYHTLGELMVMEGRLPSSELLYYLQHHEVGQLLNNRSPLLISKAIKRKKLREKMLKIQLPEMIEGLHIPFTAGTSDTEVRGSGDTVKGTPVCVGKVRGVARVVKTLEEAVNISAGDILITYSTDVGWSPYFPLLGGVVTEIGGLISHGAVVAREYGLPCVVGATNASKILQSGDLVELNGNNGTITRIHPA